MNWKIYCTKPPIKQEITTLPFSVGRKACSLTVSNPSLSREHFLITKQQNELFLVNQSMVNPILVNDEKIAGSLRLTPGATYRICAGELTFVLSQSDAVKLRHEPEVMYTFSTDGRVYGPYPFAGLHYLYTKGILRDDSLVWYTDNPDAKFPVKDVFTFNKPSAQTGVAAVVRAPAPPPAPQPEPQPAPPPSPQPAPQPKVQPKPQSKSVSKPQSKPAIRERRMETPVSWEAACEQLSEALQQEQPEIVRKMLELPCFSDQPPPKELCLRVRRLLQSLAIAKKRRKRQKALATLLTVCVVGLSSFSFISRGIFDWRCARAVDALEAAFALSDGMEEAERLIAALDPNIYNDSRIQALLQKRMSKLDRDRKLDTNPQLRILEADKRARWKGKAEEIAEHFRLAEASCKTPEEHARLKTLKTAYQAHTLSLQAAMRQHAQELANRLIVQYSRLSEQISKGIVTPELDKAYQSWNREVENWEASPDFSDPKSSATLSGMKRQLATRMQQATAAEKLRQQLAVASDVTSFLTLRDSLKTYFAHLEAYAAVKPLPLETARYADAVAMQLPIQQEFLKRVPTLLSESRDEQFVAYLQNELHKLKTTKALLPSREQEQLHGYFSHEAFTPRKLGILCCKLLDAQLEEEDHSRRVAPDFYYRRMQLVVWCLGILKDLGPLPEDEPLAREWAEIRWIAEPIDVNGKQRVASQNEVLTRSDLCRRTLRRLVPVYQRWRSSVATLEAILRARPVYVGYTTETIGLPDTFIGGRSPTALFVLRKRGDSICFKSVGVRDADGKWPDVSDRDAQAWEPLFTFEAETGTVLELLHAAPISLVRLLRHYIEY